PISLMRVPPERRAELYAEGLKRIGRSGDNDWRRFLLSECLEAYADLDEVQKERLQALLTTEPYQEIKPLMITTYERGKIAERREMVLFLLETQFGPLSPEVKQRVEAVSPENLRQLILNLMKGQSLKELGLEG
ncbi:MAG: hypothetical protein L0Z62_09165, partial [Gemmataceae bacterium]|nr:hypothetical protein [Gemmataceae bacterium]